MDTRRLFTTLLIAGGLMLAFQVISPLWKKETKPVAATEKVSTAFPALATQPTGAEPGAAPETLRLGDPSAASHDKVSIVVNDVTADIDLVELNVNDYSEYPQDRRHPERTPLVLMRYAPNVARPFSTREVTYWIGNRAAATVDLLGSQWVWKMERDPKNPYQANLSIVINEYGKDVLKITKIFRVDPKSYEVYISHEVQNLTDQPIKVQIDQMAAIDLPLDLMQLDDRFYHAAGINTVANTMNPERYNLSHAEVKKLGENQKGKIGSFLGTAHDPVEWVASSGRFFVAITRPLPETNGPAPIKIRSGMKVPVATHVASVNIDCLREEPEAVDCVGGISLTGNALDVAPHGTMSMPLSVYLGPKRQEILAGNKNADMNSTAYAYSVFEYGKVIQVSTGIYSYCAIDMLAWCMLRFLDILKASVAFGNYGVAIIIMVFVVKAALHPLTRAAQVNMAVMGKKMKDIQPLIEANKKKHAKDKQKQNEEMMRIYREKNVNPAGGLMGCLPMMLQTPIWIAVWSALRTYIGLRHAVFIPGWINDLSAPDSTITFAPIHIPLLSNFLGPISALNVLPLLLGIVVFLQMKVQAASQPKAADPQQASMQKMSQYMVLIFPLFLYGQPSGINLYYFASTLGGLVDTYFVRKSLKKKGILPASASVLPTSEGKD